MRSRHGIFVSGLFGVTAVIALVFASYTFKPSPLLAAGILSVILTFSSLLGVPRLFISEEEQRTFDLLMVLVDPGPAYFGKTLVTIVTTALTGFLLSLLYVVMVGIPVESWPLFWGSILVLSLALGASVSFAGALVLGAANRWVLAAAVAMPFLFPLVAMGVGALGAAFGDGRESDGWRNCLAILGMGVCLLALGPALVPTVWRPGSNHPRKK
ncbi:MAG: heme exporter protein CcmB [Fimbriimonadaceae bacterium]|nr:heme exporter protein CcmB [Fimbriimonadaceae bacterium]